MVRYEYAANNNPTMAHTGAHINKSMLFASSKRPDGRLSLNVYILTFKKEMH